MSALPAVALLKNEVLATVFTFESVEPDCRIVALPAEAVFEKTSCPPFKFDVEGLTKIVFAPASALSMKSSRALAEISTGPVPSPMPTALRTASSPWKTKVRPEYVLLPESVSRPVPVFPKLAPTPPETPPSEITPVNSVLKLLEPTLSPFPPRKIFPAPSIEPSVVPPLVSALMSSEPSAESPGLKITRAVPPLLVALKTIVPPSPPFVPPSAISVAALAVVLLKNWVDPPIAPATEPPRFVIVAVPAEAVSVKKVLPPWRPLAMPAKLMIVAVLAVLVCRKNVWPPP